MMLQKKIQKNIKIIDHLYGILMIGSSGTVKINLFFNVISHQLGIGKIYLCAKNPYVYISKYQLLISK